MITKPSHAKPSLYAFYFEVIKEIGLKYGYNIVLHGSLNRDLDLIAIPWVEQLGSKDEMIEDICTAIGGHLCMQNRSVNNPEGDKYGAKPHNRVCYIININRSIELHYNGLITKLEDHSDPQFYIDLSLILN